MSDEEDIMKKLQKVANRDCNFCWQKGENCDGDECEKVIAEKILAIYNQQQAEIEKLKTKVKQVKTETVKKFKEKLQATFPDREDKRCTLDDCYTLDLIDSIAEEMAGGKIGGVNDEK